MALVDSREVGLDSSKDEEHGCGDASGDDQAGLGGRVGHVGNEWDEAADKVRKADGDRRYPKPRSGHVLYSVVSVTSHQLDSNSDPDPDPTYPFLLQT